MKTEVMLHPRCPIRTALELIGGKWKLLIVQSIGIQALRLYQIRAALPDISEKMLIQELKNLCETGLVERHNYGEVPPRVEYQLTELGRLALPLIGNLADFGIQYEQKRVFSARQPLPN
jgi:DNA-binding HxlR family transcriptional regulator